jgi:1-acyl-sn-glycerol-3-phosphate acyltransferase
VPQIFLAIAVLNALVALYIFTLVPEFVMRFITWVLVNTLYRVRVDGTQNIPEKARCCWSATMSASWIRCC